MGTVVVPRIAGAVSYDPTNVAITGGSITGTNVPYVLAQSAIPFILPSSGTMGNNGAVTALTALPTTYSGGAWMYFAANQIAAGVAAGWYWFVGSTTQAGTVYNSTYSSGSVGVGTQTAFVTTGPGAFTGETAEHGGPSITLPAGAMGANGSLEIKIESAGTNNANTKQWFLYFNGTGGTNISGAGIGSSLNMVSLIWARNRGSAALQRTSPIGTGSGVGGGSGAATFTSVNTANSNTVDISLKHSGAATDNMILEGFEILVRYAA